MNWKKLQFWRKPTAPDPNLSYEIVAQYDGDSSPEGDSLVVDSLRKAGADLSLPREVLHYFYFSDEAKAGGAAAELRRSGYTVEDPLQIAAIEEAPNPWRVLATLNAVVNVSTAEETTRRFRALASQYSGEYDGWEAAAKP